MRIDGHVRHQDGTHPQALREMVLNVDKDVEVDVRGLPVCQPPGILLPPILPKLRRICRKAIVGSGEAKWLVAFAGQPPIRVPTEITAFNFGRRGGVATLSIVGFITIPVPAAIVTEAKLKRQGRGWQAVVKIPRIVGGAGSLISFRLNLKRFFSYRGERKSFLSARCPDGRFKVLSPKTVFKNEAKVPGVAAQTILKGSLVIPCTPQG